MYASCHDSSGAVYWATVSNDGFGFGCDPEKRAYQVSPGDTIFASAYFNVTDNKSTYKVADETTGQLYQETDPYGTPPASAGVVVFGNTQEHLDCGGQGPSKGRRTSARSGSPRSR